MPVPKRKRSRARRDSRFANKGLKLKSLSSCSNCDVALTGHQACANCGFYKGRKIFATKLDRKLKRTEERSKKQARTKVEATEDNPEVVDNK